MISGHGDDKHKYSQAIRADFSSNAGFWGPAPELISYLQQNLHVIGNYPEPDAGELCGGLAGFHKIKENQVLAFNGSVEAFYTIALAFREQHSAILMPAFAEYEDACRMHRHQISFFTADQDLPKADLCWVGNPNNPDGHVFAFTRTKSFLATHPEAILVVDEAYADFCPEFQSVVELTESFDNLIVVRSLTKCCAIPGLRLGYLVASAKMAAKLRTFQQPWAVNSLAQLAGKFLIDNGILNKFDPNILMEMSRQLQEKIDRMPGFRVHRSLLPFFLVEMQSGTAAQLKDYLVRHHGILIRDASNFRGLNDRFFRVCIRNETDNKLLLTGLSNYTVLK